MKFPYISKYSCIRAYLFLLSFLKLRNSRQTHFISNDIIPYDFIEIAGGLIFFNKHTQCPLLAVLARYFGSC
jgi:hypothetical protein